MRHAPTPQVGPSVCGGDLQDTATDAAWSPDGSNYISYRPNVVGGLLVQHVTPGAIGALWSVPSL
jgi:hypothetical protein